MPIVERAPQVFSSLAVGLVNAMRTTKVVGKPQPDNRRPEVAVVRRNELVGLFADNVLHKILYQTIELTATDSTFFGTLSRFAICVTLTGVHAASCKRSIAIRFRLRRSSLPVPSTGSTSTLMNEWR